MMTTQFELDLFAGVQQLEYEDEMRSWGVWVVEKLKGPLRWHLADFLADKLVDDLKIFAPDAHEVIVEVVMHLSGTPRRMTMLPTLEDRKRSNLASVVLWKLPENSLYRHAFLELYHKQRMQIPIDALEELYEAAETFIPELRESTRLFEKANFTTPSREWREDAPWAPVKQEMADSDDIMPVARQLTFEEPRRSGRKRRAPQSFAKEYC